MKETGIVFTSDSITSILALRKTMTRRLRGLKEINAAPNDWEFVRIFDGYAKFWQRNNALNELYIKCPFGKIADLIYVKEAVRIIHINHKIAVGAFFTYQYNDFDVVSYGKVKDIQFELANKFYKSPYELKGGDAVGKKISPLFMPKAAARIWLEITDVKVERVQDISEDDAIAEGIGNVECFYKNYLLGEGTWEVTAKSSFGTLWQSINGEESWNRNDFVWVVGFKLVAKK